MKSAELRHASVARPSLDVARGTGRKTTQRSPWSLRKLNTSPRMPLRYSPAITPIRPMPSLGTPITSTSTASPASPVGFAPSSSRGAGLRSLGRSLILGDTPSQPPLIRPMSSRLEGHVSSYVAKQPRKPPASSFRRGPAPGQARRWRDVGATTSSSAPRSEPRPVSHGSSSRSLRRMGSKGRDVHAGALTDATKHLLRSDSERSVASSGAFPSHAGRAGTPLKDKRFTQEEVTTGMKELLQAHRTNKRMGAKPGRVVPLKVRRPAAAVARTHGHMLHHMTDAKKWGKMMSANFSRRELICIFLRFKALCALSPVPYGIDLETFRRGTPALSVEDDLFTYRVFKVLDKDNSGYISFSEYFAGVHVLERGSRRELLDFLFKVHDENNDGALSKAELFRFFLASLRVSVNENIEQMSVTFVDGLFDAMDVDKKGYITLAEARAYIDAHPEITDIYGLFGRTMTWNHGNVEEITAAQHAREDELMRQMEKALAASEKQRLRVRQNRAEHGHVQMSKYERETNAKDSDRLDIRNRVSRVLQHVVATPEEEDSSDDEADEEVKVVTGAMELGE